MLAAQSVAGSNKRLLAHRHSFGRALVVPQWWSYIWPQIPDIWRQKVPHFKKGAIPHDPRIVMPKIEDYIDVAALSDGLPTATGIIDRESKVSS